MPPGGENNGGIMDNRYASSLSNQVCDSVYCEMENWGGGVEA